MGKTRNSQENRANWRYKTRKGKVPSSRWRQQQILTRWWRCLKFCLERLKEWDLAGPQASYDRQRAFDLERQQFKQKSSTSELTKHILIDLVLLNYRVRSVLKLNWRQQEHVSWKPQKHLLHGSPTSRSLACHYVVALDNAKAWASSKDAATARVNDPDNESQEKGRWREDCESEGGSNRDWMGKTNEMTCIQSKQGIWHKNRTGGIQNTNTYKESEKERKREK